MRRSSNKMWTPHPTSSSSSSSSPTPLMKPTLTYNRQHGMLRGHSKRRLSKEKVFLYRSVALVLLCFAMSLFVSLNENNTPWKRRRLANQLKNMRHSMLTPRHHHHHQHGSLDDYAILHHYNPPKAKEASAWTLETFKVNGVNLAQYGFELEFPSPVSMEEPYELYEDFDISNYLPSLQLHDGMDISEYVPQTDESHHKFHNLLLYHRHLDHPALGFYMDRIAQRTYQRDLGVPLAEAHHWIYQQHFDQYKSDQAAILDLLPSKTDFVVAPSNQKRGNKPFYVAYQEDTDVTTMSTDAANVTQRAYDPEEIASSIAHHMEKASHLAYLDALAAKYAPAGIVIEDRLVAYDNADAAPIQMSVYVLWGQVWMAAWHQQGQPHPTMIFRNGTAVEDKTGKREVLPSWMQWDLMVEIAEDLGAHKDVFQVDFTIGVSAETARLLAKATPEQQRKELQVVVSDVNINPQIHDLRPDLFKEMGRLWVAGYQMGIYKTVHNHESDHYSAFI